MSKFEKLTEWETGDDDRAVIVGVNSDGSLEVWHERDQLTRLHESDGSYGSVHGKSIISPWSEPAKGEVWVEVYNKTSRENIQCEAYRDQKDAVDHMEGNTTNSKTLAIVRVPWTEGQRDDLEDGE